MSLAAVLGHQFDVEVLAEAGDEHLGVVEIAIELSLERWLIRQFPLSWSQAGPERDIVVWARGVRRGFFEFSHRAIRSSILEHINPLRRQIMHGAAARALRKRHAEDPGFISEELAFHWLEAGEPEEAIPWLEHSAKRAARSGTVAVEQVYSERTKAIREQVAKDETKGGRVVTIPRQSPPKK